MPTVDRSPCHVCGSPVELVAVPGEPTLADPHPASVSVRVCSSLICESNLSGGATVQSA